MDLTTEPARPEAPGSDLTALKRDQACSYLAETQAALFRETSGLSDAQWNFKPAPHRWSIAEIVEHLAIVGTRVQALLTKIGDAAAAPSDRDAESIDAEILRTAPNPTAQLEAPERVCPAGNCAPAAALAKLSNSSLALAALLESSRHLRGTVIAHPLLGALDGYQWILVTAAHIERHTRQILGVKSDVNFPTA